MSSPGGGRTVGQVSVRVIPDTSKFDNELRRDLKKLENSLRVEIPVDFDVDENELRRKLDSIRVRAIKVPVEIDTPRPPPTVDVDADTRGAQAHVDEFVRRTDAETATVNVDANVDADTLRARVQNAVDRTNAKLQVEIDAAHLQANLDNLIRSEKWRSKIVLDVEVDQSLISKAFAAIGNAASKVFSGISSAGSATFGFIARAASGVAGIFENVGGGIAKIAVALLKFYSIATLVAAAGGTITAAWAAASAAISAVPAAIALIGAPIAAILLGMDGIKKAAQVLKPEFDQLKTAVSNAFEKGLAPAMQNIKTIMPTIQTGMVGIAGALSHIATNVTGFLRSAQGMSQLRVVLDNVRVGLEAMAPGITNITEAFLKMAAHRSGVMALANAVNTLGAEWNNAVNRLTRTEELDAAFRQLGQLLSELARGFALMMENGVQAFAAMGPGLNSFVREFTNFFDRFDFARLGKAVGDIFHGIGDALKKIPPQTIEEITAAFEELGRVFQDPSIHAFIGNLAKALPGIIGDIGDFIRVIAGIGNAIAGIIGWFNKGDQAMVHFGDTFGAVAGKFGGWLAKWTVAISTWFVELPGKVVGWLAAFNMALATWFVGQVARFGEWLAGWTMAIATWFVELPGKIVGWLTAFNTALATWFLGQVAKFGEWLAGWTVAIATWFVELPAKVAGWLLGLGEAIGAWFLAQAGRFVEWLAGWGVAIGAWFLALPGMVAGWLAGLAESVRAEFEEAKTAAVQKAQELVDQAVSWIQQLPGRITGALGNLGSLLVGAGRDLIEGLAQGIRDAMNALLAYVRGIAAQIRAAKGPHSYDVKVLIQPGEWLMEGLLKGIKSGASDVLDYIRKFTRELANTQVAGPSMDEAWARSLEARIRSEIAASTARFGVNLTGGAGGGPQVVNTVTVNNPIAERASDTINRKLRTLAQLGAFA